MRTKTTTTTRPPSDEAQTRIGGCGRPGAGRTPRTCRGCRWRTARSGRSSPPPTARTYRPSMFLTLTLPSYGPIVPGTGTPAAPGSYDYRRAALDALHFPKLVDRFWQNLRRRAGYQVQYFAAVEPQKRLAPHLHAAIRGAIPQSHPPPGRRRPPMSRCGGRLRRTRLCRPRQLPGVGRRGLRRPADRGGAADLGAGARPARRRPGRPAGACDAVRRPRPTCAASSPPHPTPTAPSATSSNTSPSPSPKPTPTPTIDNAAAGAAHRPAAPRAALPAVLAGLRELAPLRHPTRTPRTRDAARLVRLESPRSGEPRPRRPPRPRLPPMVRQNPDRAPRRPGRRRPRSPADGRHRRPRDRTARRRRALRRRAAAVRAGPTPDPTRSSTPGSSSPPSPNGNAGEPSTKPPRPHDSLWTAFRQPGRRPDQPDRPRTRWRSRPHLGLPR